MSTDIVYDAKLDTTIGCLFWGVLAATALWGIGAVQTWYYFDTYKDDRKANKYLVALVFLTDTTHQGLVMHAMYIYCIRKWGNLHALDLVTVSLYQDVSLNGATGFLVQCFFLHRIWVFRRKLLVVGCLGLLVTTNFAMQIVYAVLGSSLPTFALLRNIKGISLSINAMTAVCDVAISVVICQDLDRAKTGFSWTNSVVNRLMLFAISTGIVTSLCACASLLFYIVLPNTLVYFGVYITIGRLYQNSLLATLNARNFIRKNPESESHESRSMTNLRSSRAAPFGRETNGATPATQIRVQIETTRDDKLGQDVEANTCGINPLRSIEAEDITKGDLSIPSSPTYVI